MKPILLCIAFCLFVKFQYGQQLILQSDGTINASANYLSAGSSPIITKTALENAITKEKNEVKKNFKKKIDAAIATLNEDSTLKTKFYKWLWGDGLFSKIKNDLKAIQTQLGNPIYSKTLKSTDNPLFELDTLLGNAFSVSETFIDSSSLPQSEVYNWTFKKYDVQKKILGDYYNITTGTYGNNRYFDLKKEAYPNAISQLLGNNEFIKRTLNFADTAFGNTKYDAVLEDTLNSLYRKHIEFNSSIVLNSSPIQFLKSPFIQQWLWYTKGEVSTTPLGFTQEDLLIFKSPKKEDNKQKFYKSYVDSLNAKALSEKKLAIPDYKTQILDKLDSAKYYYIDSSEIKNTIEKNNKSLAAFTNAQTFLADIKIPFKKPSAMTHYLSYSASDKQLNVLPKSLESIQVDENVVVTVHNITPAQKLVLYNSKKTKIVDESPLSAQLNSAIGEFGNAIGILNPVKNFLNNNIGTSAAPKINLNYQEPVGLSASKLLEKIPGAHNAMSYKLNSSDEYKVFERDYDIKSTKQKMTPLNLDTFWNYVKKDVIIVHKAIFTNSTNHFTSLIPNEYHTFSENIYEEFKNLYVGRIKPNDKVDYTPSVIETMKDSLLVDYKRFMLVIKVYPIVKAASQEDYSNASSLITVLSESSLPLAKIEFAEAKTPNYKSKIFTTDFDDSSTNFEYKLISLALDKNQAVTTDTTKISSFTYKTGKRFRIQASAGIAYTTTSVTQTNVEEKANGLNITNSEQRVAVVAAFHVYPFGRGLLLQDKKFVGTSRIGGWYTRANVFIGLNVANIPKNLYLGLGYDFGPGIKINTGVHLYQYTKYEIFNNTIASKANIYKAAVPFIYLGIDPKAFVNIITNIFNK